MRQRPSAVRDDPVFDRIAKLNIRYRFCEDFAASAPNDRAAHRSEGALSDKVIGLKSNLRVTGQAWTAGIGARAGHVAKSDAAVVAALRAAGARVLSRLAMDEGALGAATDNPHFGRCENPAWPGHSAGGSSGGSAAAVAAGAVDAAMGSDTMGSVRIPAAYCGVFGLKLGTGTVSMDGVFPLAPSLDALGIFANSPARIAEVLDVILPQSDDGPEITGWLQVRSTSLTQCAPSVQAFYTTCHTALSVLLGPARAMPDLDLPALRSDAFLLTEVEAVQSLGEESGLSHGLARLIAYGRKLDAERQAKIRGRLTDASDALHRAMGRDSVMLLPTVAAPAFAHGSQPPAVQADFTVLANIAGCPAIAIPNPGTSPPVSVQLIGPIGSERRLIALGHTMLAHLRQGSAA